MTTARRKDRAEWHSLIAARGIGRQHRGSAGEGGIGAVALPVETDLMGVPRRIESSVGPLRIWRPEGEAEKPRFVETAPPALSPRMTLRDFVAAWYVPIVAEGHKDNAASTVAILWNAVDWWERLTKNEPVSRIGDQQLAKFLKELRKAKYKRGIAGTEKKLSTAQQDKLIRTLRAIFYRLGPTTDPKRHASKLLPVAPYLPPPKRECPANQRAKKVKPCVSVETARRMIAACDELKFGRCRVRRDGTRRDPLKVSAAAWWRALLLVLYYTGLRIGTVLALTWDMVQREEDGSAILEVPASAVAKTSKPIDKFIPPIVVAALDRLRVNGGDEIFRWPFCYEQLVARHKRLQLLAGVPADRILSPHAWRRTHGTEMGKLGLKHATKIAQRTLDHSDEETTRRYYVDLEAYLVRHLPEIVPDDLVDGQRRLF